VETEQMFLGLHRMRCQKWDFVQL